MEAYNTERTQLAIREYGRNVQSLVEHALTIEDREERQAFVEYLVKLIIDMHPQGRNMDDYRLKVWSHVLQMSDYKLDVDFPDNIPSTKDKRRPEPVPYPAINNRFRHYGHNVRNLIAKALEMDDDEIREEFIKVIAAYMKLSYKSWNRENVTDEIIQDEFARLTKGELEIPKNTDFDYLISPRKRSRNSSSSSSRRKRRRRRKK